MWVIVIYEEKKKSALVQHKSTDAPTQLINLLCLEKHLGINTHQSFKKSSFDAESLQDRNQIISNTNRQEWKKDTKVVVEILRYIL